jgi:CRP/FNR family transcriptional regulator
MYAFETALDSYDQTPRQRQFAETSSPSAVKDIPPLPQRKLASGENVFRAGETKSHIMRVDSGILCVSSPRPEGPPEIIELVFPGGFVGLGFLKEHPYNATAVMETTVTLWPLGALSDLCELSPEARESHHTATEREFQFRRQQLAASTADKPHLRVAAFLAAISRLNELEGRDPKIVEERPSSGEVADFLSMELSTLAHALSQLKECNLISHDEKGRLLLLDPSRLDELAHAS